MSAWEDNLPDPSKWQPRADASEKLSNAFFKRCHQIEEGILHRVRAEKDAAIDNFDPGVGIEDIFREEFSTLLPRRYAIRCGRLDDRYGKTAGDCDLIIFNDTWFPVVRAGATETSRKYHFPIEGAYGVFEIKSALSFNTLDDALAKLVACHRLHRPTTPGNRISENREITGCPHQVGNALYTTIVAVGLAPGISFEDVVNRFFAINKRLPRHEVVRALCVLGHGTVTWGFRNENHKIGPAILNRDYELPIVPLFHRHEVLQSAIYPLITDLLANLYYMILSPEDLAVKYGLGANQAISVPKDPAVFLPPGFRPETKDPENPIDY